MTERTEGAWSEAKEIWGKVKRIREEWKGMEEGQKDSEGTAGKVKKIQEEQKGRSKGFGRNIREDQKDSGGT
jgi:hypothetical protein